MPNWLSNFLYVLALSKKTQWAIILGIVFFAGINLLGLYVLSNFELQGANTNIQDAIVSKLAKKYDKAAWIALISFFALAFKCYKKDKNRF